MCGDIGSVAAKCCMKRLMHNGSGNMFARRQQGCHHTQKFVYIPSITRLPLLTFPVC